MCINNKDVLGTINEYNGFLQVKEQSINQDKILIDELIAMRTNPNRTVIDMERLFEEYYPHKVYSNEEYNYLYPLQYNSSYVCRAKYPHFISSREYTEQINNERKKYREIYFESPDAVKCLMQLKSYSILSYKKEIQKREKLIQDHIFELNIKMKKCFCPERFIYAYNYYKTLRDVSRDKHVKMITTDTLGWTDFKYQVNDDVQVYMKTNFGYGRSSYFISNIIYKGVSILPYTAVIHYYYVNWTDFTRYTNKYTPDRDNWDYALNFIVDTANLAKSDPQAFLDKWVVNELKEMMIGLRQVLNSKDADLEKYLKISHRNSIYCYSVVRDCSNNDITEYAVLPQEKIMAFKAEKITGCLYLLDNMSQFTSVSPYVQKYIDEIEHMNQKVLEEIDNTLHNITADIGKLQQQLDSTNHKLSETSLLLKAHIARIEAIFDHKKSETGIGSKSDLYFEVEKTYRQENPIYNSLLILQYDLNNKANKISSDIRLRKNFENQLNKCKGRIGSYFDVAC